MASRKSKRYGQGGMKHKRTPNLLCANGKAFKQHPLKFDRIKGRLVPAGQDDKGVAFPPSLREVRALLNN